RFTLTFLPSPAPEGADEAVRRSVLCGTFPEVRSRMGRPPVGVTHGRVLWRPDFPRRGTACGSKLLARGRRPRRDRRAPRTPKDQFNLPDGLGRSKRGRADSKLSLLPKCRAA